MGASVNEFLANFQGGGARPNRYEVILTFPTAVPFATEAGRKLQFTCKAASIPATNIGVIDVPYKGRQVKVPGDKVWDDWSVTVMLDNDFLGRKSFENWHNRINGFETNVADVNFVNPANLFATAQVYAMDRADRILRTYYIEGMFPSMVAEIQLGYDQNDMVAEQQVTFAINGWSTDDTTD